MSDLRIEDFDAYFKAVHGHPPFPWQRSLMEQVASEGNWPRLLDLPTGAGKTAALDIAVFHRALDAGSSDRRAPTRIVVVVDRRTIVDQTFDRACRIRAQLNSKDRPAVLAEVAQRLCAPAVNGEHAGALHVAMLRGGMVREETWARRPDQPTILVSTVDQVGSRLLFRGYGVSNSMRPVHAGLLGNDTLFLLDEVHLSEPFRRTLGELADRYRQWAERPLDRRLRVVEMSATPFSKEAAFGLGSDDHKDAVLNRRLRASKPVHLIEPVKVSGPEEARARKFADALAEAAVDQDIPASGRAVCVVVNRVNTARAVYERLLQRCGDRATVLLLTGRMRPADRDRIQHELQRRVGAGRPERTSSASSTIVVATQCIEAGADLDFDLLVTECASWDALKQRFGRLNRLGEVSECRGLILIRSDQIDETDDPVYGRARAETWSWLHSKGEGLDLSLAGALAREVCPGECLPASDEAPLMLPAHLDSWAQTNPIPEPDPEVALWLHGLKRESAEVQIVWRADIGEDELADASGERLDALRERLSLCPPSGGEALAVPLHAARAWLTQRWSQASDFPDAPFIEKPHDEEATETFRRVIRWRGDDSEVLSDAPAIGPGDTLVVPATYGGLTAANWAPASRTTVTDLADRVAAVDRKLPILRLLPAVLEVDFGGPYPTPPLEQVADDAEESEDSVLDHWLEQASAVLSSNGGPAWLAPAIAALRLKSRRKVVWVDHGSPDEQSVPSKGYYLLTTRRRLDATTEDDSSSFTGVAVPLDEHLQGVADWARVFARACGLPVELATAIEAAARWHDIGKADPRFQLLLHGGDRFMHALASGLLAKSSAPAGDMWARQRAAIRSGYPRGARHELMSLALLLAGPERLRLPEGIDRELVLHLVASHHGYCRPFAPAVLDPDPQTVEYPGPDGALRGTSNHHLAAFDSGVSERFFKLNRRYGWFGLAWMETILRLADHRRSEAEQQAGGAT